MHGNMPYTGSLFANSHATESKVPAVRLKGF